MYTVGVARLLYPVRARGLLKSWPHFRNFSISLGFRVSIEISDKIGLITFWLVVASLARIALKQKIWLKKSTAKNSAF